MLGRARFVLSAPCTNHLPKDQGVEIAFIGYSNAGKSSAINTVIGAGLARVSKTPGRTQQMNVFAFNQEATKRLVDLPGYGYAKVPDSVKARWMKAMDNYLTYRKSLQGLVLVMDIRHPLKPLDKLLLNWCQKAVCPVHLLLTKSDKMSKSNQYKQCMIVNAYLTGIEKTAITVQTFSSKHRQGVEQLHHQMVSWLESSCSKAALSG